MWECRKCTYAENHYAHKICGGLLVDTSYTLFNILLAFSSNIQNQTLSHAALKDICQEPRPPAEHGVASILKSNLQNKSECMFVAIIITYRIAMVTFDPDSQMTGMS